MPRSSGRCVTHTKWQHTHERGKAMEALEALWEIRRLAYDTEEGNES